jgi:VWFA-related protein
MKRALAFVCLSLMAQESGHLAKFSITSNLVIVDVTVRDRSGKPMEDLHKEDFTLLEDGKRQNIAVFEFQRMGAMRSPEPVKRENPSAAIASAAPGKVQYKDRRLIVLFFDLSSMPVEDQLRAQRAALRFFQEKMTADDLVAIMTLTARLRVEQNFTADRDLLTQTVRNFRIGEASGLASELGEGNADAAVDNGAAFTADDAEFNLFNTDRKLSALESAARMLAALPEKKALIYFSSGVGKTGIENISQLRSAVNAAVRANVAFYPVDARGLMAISPGGDASRGAPKGKGLFTGATQFGLMDSFRGQQQTLYTLAADTGGKALLDSNDLSEGITQAQKAFESYYILGYYSTNAALDGRFRRVQVRLPEFRNAHIDVRSGYFAAKRFEKMSGADKERQLEDALMLGDPQTEIPLALEVDSFRLSRERYFVPVTVKLPASRIPLARRGTEVHTVFDFVGQVRDTKGVLAGSVRDSIRVKLNEDPSLRRARGHFQYDTGFTLAPGNYRLRFLLRENQTGQMGTFETSFRVPENVPGESLVKLSSVVWSAQRDAVSAAVGRAGNNEKRTVGHPLIRNGRKLIPSVTRVFHRGQTLIAFAELYGPSTSSNHKSPSVAATLSIYQGDQMVFESDPVIVKQYGTTRSETVPVEVTAPLDKLAPGRYTSQLTVFDQIARTFIQRRAAVVILP